MAAAPIRTPKSAIPSVADDPRWARIVARDKTVDGHFWYSVATTGVYCRPSCPSRVANPGNVQLHDTLGDAKATGFRPCRRCNPDGSSIGSENTALVARACRIIERSEEVPSLAELATAIGRSPSYFHRIFKSVTGLTPKDYAAAHLAKKVRQGLAHGYTVTETIYQAGFNSSGRFYEKAIDMLGMTPSQYRAGGANAKIWFAVGQTSLGAILAASSKKGVVSILLGDDPDGLVRSLQDRFPRAHLIGADRDYEALVARVVASSRRRGLASIFRSTFAARPSSDACGRRSRKFPSANRCPMPRSSVASAHRRLGARSLARVRQTMWPSRFPAIAWCATTGQSRDTPGALSASASS